MHKPQSLLTIAFNQTELTGKIVGVDSYIMHSFEGRKIKWISYTLVSEKKGIFSRYWVVDRGKYGWFLSLPTKKIIPPKTAKLALERSGLAQIDFVGDRGPSTPSAALLAYYLGRDRYYTIECFSGSKPMYFEGHKIQKPKIIKP